MGKHLEHKQHGIDEVQINTPKDILAQDTTVAINTSINLNDYVNRGRYKLSVSPRTNGVSTSNVSEVFNIYASPC